MWQAVAVLSNFAPEAHSHLQSAATRILESRTLGANNPPSIKQYAEATVVGLLLRRPQLIEPCLIRVMANVGKNHSAIGSAILIAAQVGKKQIHSVQHRSMDIEISVNVCISYSLLLPDCLCVLSLIVCAL